MFTVFKYVVVSSDNISLNSPLPFAGTFVHCSVISSVSRFFLLYFVEYLFSLSFN